MSPHAFSEDQLVEQPAIGLFAALGWQTVSATEESFGPGGTLGRETRGEVVLVDYSCQEVAMTQEFDVVVEKDSEGFFVATVPALPGCHTQARSLDELMVRVKEAIELCLEV